ncbi:cytochrome P450 [Rhodococcus opacus]|nr:cytochrome P450 [Rhodococcus opacus]
MADTDSTATPSTGSDWAPDKVPFDEVFPTYQQMRQECPVSHTDDRGGCWNVVRYNDVKGVIKDPFTFESGVPFVGAALKERFIPLTLNPPEHQKYRRILNPLMSRQRFGEMAPAVQALVAELLAPLFAAGGGDFAAEVAYPLPARVLLKFLGLDDSTWGSLKAMSKERLEGRADPRRAREAATAFRKVVAGVVADRQKTPRDPETDFFSAILQETVDGQPLSTEDAVTIGYQLMAAGHDTTTSALASAVYLLATHPDVQQRLRADRSLIDTAVEEMLRFEPPFTGLRARRPRRPASAGKRSRRESWSQSTGLRRIATQTSSPHPMNSTPHEPPIVTSPSGKGCTCAWVLHWRDWNCRR